MLTHLACAVRLRGHGERHLHNGACSGTRLNHNLTETCSAEDKLLQGRKRVMDMSTCLPMPRYVNGFIFSQCSYRRMHI